MLVPTLALFATLTATLATQEPAPSKKLGIVVFPGVQVIEFAGPYEVLEGAHSEGRLLFDVVTVGVSRDEFRAGQSNSGIRMLADFTFDDCPKLDVRRAGSCASRGATPDADRARDGSSASRSP